MFKGLFGKGSSGDRRSAPATQEGAQPAFKTLTLGDLPSANVRTAPAPTSAPLEAPPMPTEPPVIPRIETQSMTWSDGPGRRPSDHTVMPSSPDGMKSYAASVVSPNTPQPNRYDQAWNSNGLAPPVPAVNPFYSRADDEQDDDNRSQYDNKSFFNYYAASPNPQASPDPQVQRNDSTKSTKSSNGPSLKTNMLNLDGWSPSSSRFSNPFMISPQEEYPAYPAYGGSYPYGREASPVIPEEQAGQTIRYSDCGVNPFQGLDEQARKERDSGAVGDIWEMITGQAQEVQRRAAPSSSPKINAGASALNTGAAAAPAQSTLRRSLTNYQIPEPVNSKSPVVSSPSEWFQNIIVQYAGRPVEVNRAMSYIPAPNSQHPQGLSPPEITSAAVPYLASIEYELEELRRTRVNPEREVKTQEERDRVRELIQRQLAHEQAYDALEQATGGKRLTRYQEDPAKIWEEIDLTGVRKEIPLDRRSISSTGTAWPTFENKTQNVPPVPKIPDQHVAAAKVQKESIFTKAFKSPFKRPKKEENSVVVVAAPREDQETREVPIMFSPAGLGIEASALGPAKRLSMDSNTTFPGPGYSRSAPERDTFADRYAPSRQEMDSPLDEKVRSPGHARTGSTNTVSAPPPYSRGASPNLSKGQNSKGFQRISEEAPIQSRPRFPVRASDVPRISTASSGLAQQYNANVGTLSHIPFTPTTPNHARHSIPQSRPLGGNVSLHDLASFRGNSVGDQRRRAEKQRQKQEKREKLFGRGGWFYLCGCFFVRSTSKKLKFFWWTFFISIVVICTTLGTILAVRASNAEAPAEEAKPLRLINLPNLPPMPAEEITITPRLINTVSTCVAPSTLWSCKLPQPLADGAVAERPVFRWKVWSLNGTDEIAAPDPILPLLDEYKNMSKIDGVMASPPEGEPTNFYINLLQSNTTTTPSSTVQEVPQKVKRSHGRHFPRATASPSASPSAKATQNLPLPPANILPTQYTSQQLRFFDRGLPTEHFKFITHFQKTIYLRTISALGSGGTNSLDADGGVSPSEARFVCSWSATRFVVKIFTRPDEVDDQGKRKFVVDPSTIGVIKGANAGGFAGYAVQIEEDIATYDTSRRSSISCWSINDRQQIDTTSEQRKFLAEGISTGKSGVDYKGCQCSWSNFKSSTGQGL
ncbi:hypothetical protein AOL_s00043g640 [Orbilia oligospora ATCC 24927]|uniref:Glycoprotease family protein n=1 Tax=Arthrobotrys oligospora (strain ATCC 24927 / CBS 115.81 / DSM 1491) TaxID=756982 RepID=G1X4L6_ARTOA|nr:hypothetical protein AOL_s00043g640 [Orbilia oligospora ATCC 24927]EGX51906.1 hypothetical protein AOL_s00043g640 [Orbilia oligospora ATCC 24927]